mgnify:FL=1
MGITKTFEAVRVLSDLVVDGTLTAVNLVLDGISDPGVLTLLGGTGATLKSTLGTVLIQALADDVDITATGAGKKVVLTGPGGVDSIGALAVTGALSASGNFAANGIAPGAPGALGAVAVDSGVYAADAPAIVALLNNVRTALIASGIATA